MKTTALSISPSGNWGGNDGLWSTFVLQLGNPNRQIEVLPATSGNAIWAVNPLGCANQPFSTSDCEKSRGGVFAPNGNFKWIGGKNTTFWLDFSPENDLGGNYTAETQLYFAGRDDVVFGFSTSDGPTLKNQFIANYAGKTPYVGLLGLTPYPTNNSDWQEDYPSVLGTLAAYESAPLSSYWAYTAGAYYRDQHVPASLTFGGYDEARGNKDDVLTVPTTATITRDLVVDITAIDISSASGASTHIPGIQIAAFIDSVIPEIWLPSDLCDHIQDAFGLDWNDDLWMYIVSEDQHRRLVSQNATISFTLSSSTPISKSITIALSYEAFYQEIRYPLAGILDGSVLHYFPIRKTINENQYTLGRVFLQEAYLAVDYQQEEFYLSQAQFPADQHESLIVAVQPDGKHIKLYPDKSPTPSVGAIVGIALGAVALVLIVLGLLYWFRYRPWSKKRKSRQYHEKMRQDHRDTFGYYGNREKDGGDTSDETYEKREMDATETVRGSVISRSELPSPPLPQYSPGSPGRDWPKDRGSAGGEMAEMGDYLTARRRAQSPFQSPIQSPIELSADGEHERRPPPVEMA